MYLNHLFIAVPAALFVLTLERQAPETPLRTWAL